VLPPLPSRRFGRAAVSRRLVHLTSRSALAFGSQGRAVQTLVSPAQSTNISHGREFCAPCRHSVPGSNPNGSRLSLRHTGKNRAQRRGVRQDRDVPWQGADPKPPEDTVDLFAFWQGQRKPRATPEATPACCNSSQIREHKKARQVILAGFNQNLFALRDLHGVRTSPMLEICRWAEQLLCRGRS
jgi:hypothetical protein